jgi:oligoribonuclease
MSDRILLFLDLETTGLDPARDSIIEVAWAFTDEAFNVIGEPRTFLVEPKSWDALFDALRAREVVREMHKASGLFEELTNEETVGTHHVAEVLEGEIRALPAHTSLHLAGYSVHFDRSFLERNSFGFCLDLIHHRHLDLSSVKLLLDAVGVAYVTPINGNPHRALADVIDSIEQARIFAAQLGPVAGVA